MSARFAPRPHNRPVPEFTPFESLLSDVSEMLVTLPIGRSNAKITYSLIRLAEWLGIDRCILFQLSEDQTTFSQTYTSGTGIQINAVTFTDDEIRWLIEHTQDAGGVICQRTNDLPSVPGEEQAFARRHGIKSYTAVLLKSGSIVLGLLFFQTRRADYVWPDYLTHRLTVIGHVFSGVLLRQYTEDTLRDSHDQVVATLKASPDLMLEVDQAGLIYGYHLPTHEAFHLPTESLVGQRAAAVLSPAAAAVLEKALVGASEQVHYRSAPYVLDTPDGQRWYELSAARKGIAETQDKHFIVFIRDITERMRAEEVLRERDRLRAALETEKELHRIKNNLMRTISHEFRAPLAVIGLASSLLSDYFEKLTFQQRTRQLNTIRNQVNKLDQMVGEILSAVSGVFKGLVFEPSLTDLELLCQLSVSEVQSTIGAGHHIVCESQDCPHNAWVDQRLVNRILINLLSNAIKYSPEGSVIRVRVFEEASEIVLQVTDQGIGISQEDQQQLFEPFFRAGNVGAISGFGLGLTIVRDCVALHQGMVTVNSKLNHGTTFTVRLPGKNISDRLTV
ncbi:MAG: PAS domain-containing sensor histidine kinase [Anaerolineae bacterium]|nr:PAS domain-containing sensor histidine kinase [Anaerolineae bacterium]